MAADLTRRHLLQAAALGSAAWLAGGCDTATSAPARIKLVTRVDVDAGGNRVSVLRATSTPRDGTAPLALYCHGNGGDAMAAINKLNIGQHHHAVGLARAGYIVISSDMAGLGTWGNNAAMRSINTAIMHARSRYGARRGKVLITGISMGGAAAMAYAATHPSRVAGCVAIAPIVDLSIAADHGLPGVDDAYTGGYSDARYGEGHNPMAQARAGMFDGMPLQVWYASDDMYVPTSVSRKFVRAVRAGDDAQITATMLDGTHSEATTASVPRSTMLHFARSVLPVRA